jgi:hypothetical protein
MMDSSWFHYASLRAPASSLPVIPQVKGKTAVSFGSGIVK